MNHGQMAMTFIGTLGPVRARLTSAQRWVVTPKGAGDHRLPEKGSKGRSHRNPRGSTQDVKGESDTAQTPVMDSDVETAAAMVKAASRERPVDTSAQGILSMPRPSSRGPLPVRERNGERSTRSTSHLRPA
jgi:hypothetical protein